MPMSARKTLWSTSFQKVGNLFACNEEKKFNIILHVFIKG